MQPLTITRPDDRTLQGYASDAGPAVALVLHTGTPTAAVPFPPLTEAVTAAGLRLVTWSRPGYATSTRQPGRTVGDVAADTRAVLDQLGVERFVTIGWSGGGPHALACAALMPGRCAAAASLAGVAPLDAEGLAWLEGMGEENITEFAAAMDGVDALTPMLTEFAQAMAGLTGDGVAAGLGDLIPPADADALTGEFADWMAAQLRAAVSTGIDGWLDDDLAFFQPWGFELGAITVPVSIWQGGQDRMVPEAHGTWLAEHIPGATAFAFDDEGHLSIYVAHIGDVLAELTSHL